MEVYSVGVVTPGCKDCKFLKKRMASSFYNIGITLIFNEVDYTADEDYAMEICEKYGFDDIPAFEVAGVVFTKGYDEDLVGEACRVLGI